jgi:hypothetical protein
MALVAITRLRVRAWRYMPALLIQAFRSARQASLLGDCHSTAVLREAHRTFWTITIWADETAMRNYMSSGIHRRVMPKLAHWCDEGSEVHWSQDSSEAPTGSLIEMPIQGIHQSSSDRCFSAC